MNVIPKVTDVELDEALFEQELAARLEEMSSDPQFVDVDVIEDHKRSIAKITEEIRRTEAEADVRRTLVRSQIDQQIAQHNERINKAQELIAQTSRTVAELQARRTEEDAEIRREAAARKEALERRKRAHEAFLAEMEKGRTS